MAADILSVGTVLDPGYEEKHYRQEVEDRHFFQAFVWKESLKQRGTRTIVEDTLGKDFESLLD